MKFRLKLFWIRLIIFKYLITSETSDSLAVKNGWGSRRKNLKVNLKGTLKDSLESKLCWMMFPWGKYVKEHFFWSGLGRLRQTCWKVLNPPQHIEEDYWRLFPRWPLTHYLHENTGKSIPKTVPTFILLKTTKIARRTTKMKQNWELSVKRQTPLEMLWKRRYIFNVKPWTY